MARGPIFTNVDERRASSNFNRSSLVGETSNKYNIGYSPLKGGTHGDEFTSKYVSDYYYPRSHDNNFIDVDASGYGVFDGVVNYCTQLRGSSLGTSDLSKYEPKVFRTRYLSEGLCPSTIYSSCRELALTYANKIDDFNSFLLDEKLDPQATISRLESTGIITDDFIRHLTIVAIGARGVPILYLLPSSSSSSSSCTANTLSSPLDGFGQVNDVENLEKDFSNGLDIVTLVLNVLRSIVFGVCRRWTCVDKNELIAHLYRFIKCGYGHTEGVGPRDYGMSNRSLQRLVLVYALAIDALNNVLSRLDSQQAKFILPSYDDVYDFLFGISCCFIEELVHGNIKPRADVTSTFHPSIATLFELCLEHWALVYHLLDCGVAIPCTTSEPAGNPVVGVKDVGGMLTKHIKVLCFKFEDDRECHSLVAWIHMVYLKLSPLQASKNKHNIPKMLFYEVSICESTIQLRAICETLGNCLRSTVFYDYVQRRIDFEKFIRIFLFKTCHRIHHEQDDLAVLMLCLFNQIVDLHPTTLTKLAKLVTLPSAPGEATIPHDKLNEFNATIKASLHTLFSVAVHGKGSIQPVICLVLTKLLAVSDISKSLEERDRNSLFKTLLSGVGVFAAGSGTNGGGGIKSCGACEMASKCAVLDALVKTAGLATISRLLNNIGIAEIKNMALKEGGVANVGTGPSINSALFVGNFASRLLAYDSLTNSDKRNSFSGSSFMTCVLTLAFKSCKGLEHVFKLYCNEYSKVKGVSSAAHMVGFTRLVPILNPASATCCWQDKFKTSVLLFHFMVSSIYNASDSERKAVLSSMLTAALPSVSGSLFPGTTSAQDDIRLKSLVVRLDACKRRMGNQVSSLKSRNNELEANIQCIETKYKSNLVRLEQEIQSYKSSLTSAKQSVDELQHKLEKQRHTNELLLKENSRVKSEYDSTTEKLRAANDKCTQYESDNRRLRAQIRELEANVSKMARVTAENQRMSQQLEETTQYMDQLCKMLIQLAYKHKTTKENMAKTLRDLHDASARVNSLKRELESVKTQYNSKNKELENASNENSRLHSELTRKRQECSSAQNSMQDLRARCEELENRVKDLSKRNRRIEDENTTMREKFGIIQYELSESKRKIQAIASTFNSKNIL